MLLIHETFDQVWTLDRGCRLELMQAAQNSRFSGVTDDAGRVTLRGQFQAGGRDSLLMRHGRYGISGQIGVVTDTDILMQQPLESLLPDVQRSLDDELPEIELALDATRQ